VSLEQTFQNDDPTAVALEVIYRFPLDAQAILTSFSVQKKDNTIIHGKVAEKEEAKVTYDEALANGQGGYLLQEEGELKDVFSLKVGNLQAGETVKVRWTKKRRRKTRKDGRKARARRRRRRVSCVSSSPRRSLLVIPPP